MVRTKGMPGRVKQKQQFTWLMMMGSEIIVRPILPFSTLALLSY
jgi:hypothetical protein